MSNLDVKVFLNDNKILSCNYAGSGFIDKDHWDIVTVDLWVVGNNKFMSLFIKDRNYRETNNISWEKAKSTVIDGLSDYMDTGCSKQEIDKSALMEWKGKVMEKVDEN